MKGIDDGEPPSCPPDEDVIVSAPAPVDSGMVYDELGDREVAGRWSEVVHGGPPQLSVRWLRCHEGSFDRPSRYAVASGTDGRPDAVTVFHLRRPDDHHTKYRLATALANHSTVTPAALDAPSLVVVAPSSYVSGLHVRDGLPSGRAHAATDALRRTLLAVARDEGAGTVLLPHLADPAQRLFEGAIRFPMRPSAYLDLRGARSFDNYLASLPGRRRRETMRERRRFAAAGLRIRTSSTLDHPERLVDRQLAHYRRYGLDASRTRIAGQFRALAEHYCDHLLLLEVLRGDEELGHVVAVHEGDWVIPKLAAFRGRESFGYFEAGYYAVIDWALGGLGCTRIDYGGAAIDAKERRGCTVRTLAGAVLSVA